MTRSTSPIAMCSSPFVNSVSLSYSDDTSVTLVISSVMQIFIFMLIETNS